MARVVRPVLAAVGTLCVVAGMFPCSYARPHATDGDTGGDCLGLPFSPLFRICRTRTEPPPPARTLDDGTVESSSFSVTVYRWELRPFSWSMVLVLAGAAVLFVALRSPREAP